jgi:hypothetical protein
MNAKMLLLESTKMEMQAMINEARNGIQSPNDDSQNVPLNVKNVVTGDIAKNDMLLANYYNKEVVKRIMNNRFKSSNKSKATANQRHEDIRVSKATSQRQKEVRVSKSFVLDDSSKGSFITLDSSDEEEEEEWKENTAGDRRIFTTSNSNSNSNSRNRSQGSTSPPSQHARVPKRMYSSDEDEVWKENINCNVRKCGTDDDAYFKKGYNKGVIKFTPTQECRPAKSISKRVNINTIQPPVIWDLTEM